MSTAMASEAGLVLDEVRAGYGDTVVLNGVSFAVPPRATLAVLGRNGVGKSTLLATVMGRTAVHGGRLRFAGTEITRLPPYCRSRLGLGFVPQEREIFGSLTVEENLAVAARPGRWSLARVYDFFPALAARRRARGNELSGGEQQMLSIGRALIGNPTLLLMDEPLEGLAPVIVEAVLEGLERLKREDDLAIVLVEQHAWQILPLTDEAIVLERGRIVHRGSSAALAGEPHLLDRWLGVARAAGPLRPNR